RFFTAAQSSSETILMSLLSNTAHVPGSLTTIHFPSVSGLVFVVVLFQVYLPTNISLLRIPRKAFLLPRIVLTHHSFPPGDLGPPVSLNSLFSKFTIHFADLPLMPKYVKILIIVLASSGSITY